MQINSITDYRNNSVNFNANLKLKHILNLKNEPILTKDFEKSYSAKVDKLGNSADSVKIDVMPNHTGDYLMDVEVVRNGEKHKKAQALLLCPDIKTALPKFLEGEYKCLVSWFKDKNGMEKLK